MNLPPEAGAFDDDPQGRAQSVRTAILAAIAANSPLFPQRALGLEYAALAHGPRGIPIAEVAVANLRVGESFPLNGEAHRVTKVGKRITFARGAAGSPFTTSPDLKNWEQFIRDVGGLLLGAAHGCDAGDLPAAWQRDPFARYASA